MFFYSAWIQKRRAQRKLMEEAETRKLMEEAETRKLMEEAETRKLMEEAETRKLMEEANTRKLMKEAEVCKERDHQQAQALLVTLYKLQDAIGPLIATQVYNSHFCPLISRLPEELLLCIFDFLRDDVVALHCLRSVSRTFRRILNRGSIIWRDEWYRPDSSPISGDAFYLHDVYNRRFRRLLQRDGRCNNCRSWNDAHSDSVSEDCKIIQTDVLSDDAVPGYPRCDVICCFACESNVLCCHACDFYAHDLSQFSFSERHKSVRQCLGQQGSVQLCEHKQITWAIIKSHIEKWRQGFKGSLSDLKGFEDQWQRCLESFNIECHDPSHDMRCTASEAPTWPRARLSLNSSTVVLSLQWRPHSRIDALSLAADGRIPITELTTLFQTLRTQGPVDSLCSPCRPGALPEMALLSPSSTLGRFIYYMKGEDDGTGPPPSIPPLPSKSRLSWMRHHGSGTNGRQLDITLHYPTGVSGIGLSSQCLVAAYKKDIKICGSTVMLIPDWIEPTHDWLNAMDTRTYSHPHASHVRPQCEDMACFNYYQRRK
ncbi:Caldesmon multi-domain protein [Pyrenophora teres f. teres]|uniref:Caldesmon multi-domain protein n=1 Tax=Pyrenophora teres f. teres TaxID=97479 RepID=A0A6S6W973_9PLEO|nr:Caldesmon multi-domain protein [Pyrenophora teres f. teres]